MIVVSNSSPLVALSAIGEAELLADLYGRVVVPDAVWVEVVEQGAGKPGTEQLAAATWLQRGQIADTTLVSALQEQLGRRTARRLGLRVVGVIGVLVEAKRRGRVPAIKPLLERLRDVAGFRIGAALVARVLADEDEA